ncbi:MAG: hypothetical protein M3R68_10270 [Acidobacteriota bacterium]|nr:hypothetical protein [Acidobacteriota bacterium]
MKTAGLIIGIVLMILSGITFVVCLALPTMTDGRVSSQESMLGLIPAAIFFFLAFVLTVISAIFVFKGKKKSA